MVWSDDACERRFSRKAPIALDIRDVLARLPSVDLPDRCGRAGETMCPRARSQRYTAEAVRCGYGDPQGPESIARRDMTPSAHSATRSRRPILILLLREKRSSPSFATIS